MKNTSACGSESNGDKKSIRKCFEKECSRIISITSSFETILHALISVSAKRAMRRRQGKEKRKGEEEK